MLHNYVPEFRASFAQEPVGLWVTFLFPKDSKERCKVKLKVQNRKVKGVIIELFCIDPLVVLGKDTSQH